MTESVSEQPGPFVRLWGVEKSQLPSSSIPGKEPITILTSILHEAIPFLCSVPSSSILGDDSRWSSKGTKTFSHSTAPVHLYERTMSVEDLKAVTKEHLLPHVNVASLQSESWAFRRSTHEDAAQPGTASWDEWKRYFKEGHAEAERDFTPAILSTKMMQQWDCSGIEIPLLGDTWVDLTLKLEESVHKLPAPLQKRVFPVLQVTASAQGRREFIVVQVAFNPDGEAREEARVNGSLHAMYTSVERLRETEEGIEWIMGTASDAKGVLPAWVQRMAVPGQIAKDVDMFLSWIAVERRKHDELDG